MTENMRDALAVFSAICTTFGSISSCAHVPGGWLQSSEPYTF